MFTQMKIELAPKEDRYGNLIYFGRHQSPSTLKFVKGAIFFAFTSEDGNEELHIGCVKPGSQCNSIKKRMNADGSVDRYVIPLEARQDIMDKPTTWELSRMIRLSLICLTVICFLYSLQSLEKKNCILRETVKPLQLLEKKTNLKSIIQ